MSTTTDQPSRSGVRWPANTTVSCGHGNSVVVRRAVARGGRPGSGAGRATGGAADNAGAGISSRGRTASSTATQIRPATAAAAASERPGHARRGRHAVPSDDA